MAKSNYTNTILTFVILALLVFLVYTYINRPQTLASALKISIGEAKARRFGLIVDVRTPRERDLLGYYPNSIPISIEKLRKEVPLDISSKKTHILVYSNGDDRAKLAAQLLYNMGYSNARYINETYLSLMPGSK
jgi:rhodanese-related sulfurtransferase